jgi:hypothetical protein
MADENDFSRGLQGLCDLFMERIFLRNTLPRIV